MHKISPSDYFVFGLKGGALAECGSRFAPLHSVNRPFYAFSIFNLLDLGFKSENFIDYDLSPSYKFRQ